MRSLPLKTISQIMQNAHHDIHAWFQKHWQHTTPLPYFSCDVRHSSYKIGIVDTNLFPAGFNNLCNTYTQQTAAALRDYFNQYHPKAVNIALLGENHTRNKFYLLNLLKIQQLLITAGFNCRITIPLDHFPQETVSIFLETANSQHPQEAELVLHQPQVHEQKLFLGQDFTADLILANNDFSSGIPEIFKPLKQLIIPSPQLGWQHRSKSHHFTILNDLVEDLAKQFSFDPWLIHPITQTVDHVSENQLSDLATVVDDVLEKITKKYEEYQINQTPYVFVKNDSGTYGLGVTSVFSSDEIRNMNRKKRNKLFSAKGNLQNQRFIVQEGIPTADTYSECPIEPVIYGIGKKAVGGFFRLHAEKNEFESLNSPGMSFSCLCLHKLDESHESHFLNCQEKQDLIKSSFFITELASLAAAKEQSLTVYK